MLIISIFIFILALGFALLEIEIEGAHGWAEKLPTWYRVNGPISKKYNRLTKGKPLTGYHCIMFTIPFLFFHFPFFLLGHWSFANEFAVLGLFLFWCVLWDFLWFVFNPYFGIMKFRQKKIWWHKGSTWIFGVCPIEYIYGLVASIIFYGLSSVFSISLKPISNHLYAMFYCVILTSIAIIFSPLYKMWYFSIREKDERHLVETSVAEESILLNK